ncbi:SH3 domain-containing protein, partial [Candidatus Thiothrix sp. Deng01]
AWLEKRNADCGKLTDETPAADGMGIAECVFKAVIKRADELEKIPRPANGANQSNTSTATQGEWYTSTAKPVLVVRSTPDVTGKKIGTVPEGDKVKVLEKDVKADFISGYSGSWVKIESLLGSIPRPLGRKLGR